MGVDCFHARLLFSEIEKDPTKVFISIQLNSVLRLETRVTVVGDKATIAFV